MNGIWRNSMDHITLERLADDIDQGRDIDHVGRAYLHEAIARALAGKSDPFRLKPPKPRGRPPDPYLPQRQIAMAMDVASKIRDEGLSIAAACGTGANGGTQSKAFEKYRANLEACRLIYGARNAQRDMSPEESASLSRLLADDLRRRGRGKGGNKSGPI
jgi:hypothetical protein